MIVFQLVLVPLCIILGLLGLRRKALDLQRILWALFWFGSAACIAVPSSLTTVANLLGIGRGTDFVLYIALLSQPIVWAFLFRRIQGLQGQITVLVRDDAIANACVNDRDRTPCITAQT